MATSFDKSCSSGSHRAKKIIECKWSEHKNMSNYTKILPPETQKRHYDKLRDLGFTDIVSTGYYLKIIKEKCRFSGTAIVV